jgi:hypothetical protein
MVPFYEREYENGMAPHWALRKTVANILSRNHAIAAWPWIARLKRLGTAG